MRSSSRPSVPGITGYFHGFVGYYQRDAVDADVAAVAQQRAGAMDRIRKLSFADIRKDPQLLAVAETAGRITFAENCQPCHGAGGGGNPGFPALAAGNWLWGERIPKLIGNAHPNVAPYDLFQTKTRPIFLGVGNDAQFRKAMTLLGCPELIEDARFKNNAARNARSPECCLLAGQTLVPNYARAGG